MLPKAQSRVFRTSEGLAAHRLIFGVEPGLFFGFVVIRFISSNSPISLIFIYTLTCFYRTKFSTH